MSQLIYNLEKYIKVDDLEKIHFEICSGISQSQTTLASRIIPHYEMQGDIQTLIKFKKSERDRVTELMDIGLKHLSREERKQISDLTYEQKKRFLQLYKKAYTDGEYVRLKYPKREFWDEPGAIFYDNKCEWHDNIKFFPQLQKFINTLPFTEIGRVLFFVTYAYVHSDVHYDRENAIYNGQHHYVWINPFKNKRFFLLSDEGKKTYVEHRAAIFDGMILHGAEPTPYMSYTMRIDGQLEKHICDELGLSWIKRTV